MTHSPWPDLSPLERLCDKDEDIAQQLKTKARIRRFDPKTTIVLRHAEDRDVFVLLEGRARAVVYSSEGHEIWLDDLVPGDIFGEMAALAEMPRTAEIRAVEPVAVAVYSDAEFLRMMGRHGHLGIVIARRLIDRLQRTTQRMYELSALSAPGRVYAELLRSAEFGRDEGREAGVIRPPPQITELAKRVNSTRETASRTISDLERKGLVIRREDCLIVLAPKELGMRLTGLADDLPV